MSVISFLQRFFFDRDEYLRSKISKEDPGLEVGPSYRPIARKDAGYQVEIIDHLDTKGLRDYYRDHYNIDVTKIEEVDYVWSGQDYLELTGKPKHYQWIIASHVIEHCPDLVGFLLQCDSILNESGKVILAAPDKRFCFDVYRQVSGVGQVIDRHLQKLTRHTPGEVAENFLHCVNLDGKIAWSSRTRGNTHMFHPESLAKEKMQGVMENDEFTDVHSWCFTPHSFHLLIHDLHTLGFIPFYVEELKPVPGCEFICVLTKDPERSLQQDRLELLRAVVKDLRAIKW